MRPRIFLVDDEQPVLDGLSATIRKFFPEVDICGYAKSGREAVEGVARERPEIVLMDVRMPGLSGLDALRELRTLAPDTLPILLTAYERFDIAREAFGLGVYDYLAKPVEQETLVTTLRGALEKQAERKEASLRAAAARNELELARPLLEEGFIYTIISGDADEESLRAYADRLGIAPAAGIMAAVARKRRPLPYPGLDRAEAADIRAEMEYRTPCIVGAPAGDALPVFFPGNDAEAARKALSEVLGALGETAPAAGIGTFRSGSELRLSWAEALAAIEGAEPEAEEGTPERDAARTLRAAAEGDLIAAVKAFARYCAAGPSAGSAAALAGAAASLFGCEVRAALSAGEETARVLAAGAADADSRCAAVLGAALAAVPGEREGDGAAGGERDRRVSIALAFIAESYARQISLDDAAARVGLGPARLSRLLANATGKSFIEHLTEARIRSAKEALAAGLKSVKEIAADCGYPDANYFSRAFKKATGTTPSEYADRHGRSIL